MNSNGIFLPNILSHADMPTEVYKEHILGHCAHCGNPFWMKLSNDKYCSSACTHKAWKARRKTGETKTFSHEDHNRQTSRPIFCPQLYQSFTSVKNAAYTLGITRGAIHHVLRGLRRRAYSYDFVPYDPEKHPPPKHLKRRRVES